MFSVLISDGGVSCFRQSWSLFSIRIACGGSDNRNNHPFMWAWTYRCHHVRLSFYSNYLFGSLFSMGLYPIYGQGARGFQKDYDCLQRDSGEKTAADLVALTPLDLISKERNKSLHRNDTHLTLKLHLPIIFLQVGNRMSMEKECPAGAGRAISHRLSNEMKIDRYHQH
jgi:hypothetical protein